MTPKRLTSEISVSPQLHIGEMSLVHALGFRSVICNRPDGEAVDQPLFETIRQLGLNSGIETAYVPLKPEKSTDEDLALMTEMVHQLPKPILAYCGTGARSEALLKKIIESDHEA
jgi:sulfide:quinone oxidoreductase